MAANTMIFCQWEICCSKVQTECNSNKVIMLHLTPEHLERAFFKWICLKPRMALTTKRQALTATMVSSLLSITATTSSNITSRSSFGTSITCATTIQILYLYSYHRTSCRNIFLNKRLKIINLTLKVLKSKDLILFSPSYTYAN